MVATPLREIAPASMAAVAVAASIVSSLVWGEPWASAYALGKCLVIAAVLGVTGYLVQRRIYRPPAG